MKTYDPKNVSLILGSHIATEFEDGTFIQVERNNDTWAIKKGASGETARAKSNDRSGIFTFTPMQTSPTNDFLSALAIADETNNSGVIPVMLIENGGTTVASAAEAWVRRPSPIEYSKTVGARSWILETGDLFMNVGSIPSN